MTTSEQMERRHTKSWTGISARAELVKEGVEEWRIKRAEEAIGLSLSNFYIVGNAVEIHTGLPPKIYVYVDDNPATPAKYYIGMRAILNGESHSYEELRAGAN